MYIQSMPKYLLSFFIMVVTRSIRDNSNINLWPTDNARVYKGIFHETKSESIDRSDREEFTRNGKSNGELMSLINLPAQHAVIAVGTT